jgi:hypothetical protein
MSKIVQIAANQSVDEALCLFDDGSLRVLTDPYGAERWSKPFFPPDSTPPSNPERDAAIERLRARLRVVAIAAGVEGAGVRSLVEQDITDLETIIGGGDAE